MQGNTQLQPVLVDLKYLNQLRRDWEAAFALQLQNGRSGEHFQRLLRKQFEFLENVVLDLSKKCHSLQDQVVAERSANERLTDVLNASRSETKDLISSLVKRIENLERSQNSYQDPMNDLMGEIGSIKSITTNQQSQLRSLEDAMNTQKTAIQNITCQQIDIKNEESVNLQHLNNSLQIEIDKLKNIIAEEKGLRKAEALILEESLTADKLSMRNNEKSIAKLSEDVNALAIKMDRQHSMTKIEQNTILSVIKTISGSISNLRKDVQAHDSRQTVKIETLRTSIIEKIKSEIKSVSRPLIIS